MFPTGQYEKSGQRVKQLSKWNKACVVLWNYRYFRQSKRLVNLVEQNLKLNAGKEQSGMIFVNTDLMKYEDWVT